MKRLCTLIALAAPTSAAAQDWAPGEQIDEAAAIQITRAGFESAADLAAVLIPGAIDIPVFEEKVKDPLFGSTLAEIKFEKGWVAIEIAEAQLIPGNGLLDLDMDLNVQLNDSNDRFELYIELLGIGDTCYGWVDPFPVNAITSIAMQVVEESDGTKLIDAQVGAIEVDFDLSSDDIELKDCAIGTLEDVLNYLNLSLYDLILGQVDGLIKDAIGDAAPELETALSEAFSAASINETFSVGDAELSLSLQPDDLAITPDGMEIKMAGSTVSDPSDCVSAYDTGGSLKTMTAVPGINSAQDGVGILLSDDFANQALYSLWRSGLLCYTLDDSESLPLNTAILGLLAGDSFDQFFPSPQPIIIATKPEFAPVISYDGTYDVTAEIPGLGLDIFAELDGRWTRLLGLTLDAEVGIDLNFNGATGVLGVELFFDTEAIGVSVGFNELAPEANDVVIEKFSTVFGSLVEPLIGGLLGEDLSFALGSLEGVGLTSLEAAPAGSGDWLELSAGLGAVPYEGCSGGGCGADGADSGCSGEGEEGSECSAIHGHSRTIWLLPLGLVALLRRRR